MSTTKNYVIRHAGPADHDVLDRIARLDTQLPLTGHVLMGEIDGEPAAAVSLADGRIVADPFMYTANLTPLLRVRYRAHRARPHSLADRLLAGMHARRPAEA